MSKNHSIFIFFLIYSLCFFESCQRRDKAQFEVLKSDYTGITFDPNSKSKSTDPNLIKDFGCAVSVVNIDADSLPDLVFSSFYGRPELYLNKGNFLFENVTAKSGIRLPECFNGYGVAVVDINNDNKQDLYFCNNGGCGGNKLYVNNGDMTFTDRTVEYGLDIVKDSYMPYFFDYNRDGYADLFLMIWPGFKSNPFDIAYLTKIRNDSSSLHSLLFKNHEGKFFEDVTDASGLEKIPATNNGAIISDINQDGWPDIYVGNDFILPDQLYINHQGHFENSIKSLVSKTSMFSMGLDCADLNNDLFPDIIEADMLSPDHYRRKMNTLALSIGFYDELKQKSIPQYQRNTIQMNNEGRNFSEAGYLSSTYATEWTWSPLAADFDNDGLKDIFYSAGSRRELTNMDYLANYSNTSAAYDPTQQWLLDWRNIPSYNYHNFIFKNTNGFQFADMSSQWGVNKTTDGEGAAYADFDGDGDLDIVICNSNIAPYILKNNISTNSKGCASIRFRLHSKLNEGYSLGTKVYLYTGKNKQYVEAITAKGFISVSENVIHFGIGKYSTADSAVVVWPSGNRQALYKLDANKIYDLYEQNANKQNDLLLSTDKPVVERCAIFDKDFVHREDVFNDFKRDKIIPRQLSRLGPGIGKCDLDNDGREDIFVGGAHGQNSCIYRQNASGTFSLLPNDVFHKNDSTEDITVAFDDIDRNGFKDIIIGSGSNADNIYGINQNLKIYLNDGGMKFRKYDRKLPMIPEIISTISTATVAGKEYIFIGSRMKPGEYGKIPKSYLLENRQGMLVDVTEITADNLRNIGMVTTSTFEDIDKDGIDELLISGEFMPICVFKMNNDRWSNVTAKSNLAKTAGWWNCIKLVDVNNDGYPDILAGNWGLNSIFCASEQKPISLWVNDFDKNGSTDPILFHFLKEVNAPFVGRDLFCKQMPFFFNRFNNYDSYARCDSSNIFDSSALAGVKKYYANKLQSACFINNGKGQYNMVPLPVQAQVAPINDFIIFDFNSDGLADFIPVGNTNSNFYDQGNIDALRGRIFLGDGKGGFIPSILPPSLNQNEVVNHCCLLFDTGLKKSIIVAGTNNDTIKTYTISKF